MGLREEGIKTFDDHEGIYLFLSSFFFFFGGEGG